MLRPSSKMTMCFLKCTALIEKQVMLLIYPKNGSETVARASKVLKIRMCRTVSTEAVLTGTVNEKKGEKILRSSALRVRSSLQLPFLGLFVDTSGSADKLLIQFLIGRPFGTKKQHFTVAIKS